MDPFKEQRRLRRQAMLPAGQGIEPAELPHPIERINDLYCDSFLDGLADVSPDRVLEAIEDLFLVSLRSRI